MGVLLALVSQSGVGKPTLLRVIESAESLGSDSNKAQVLISMARMAEGDTELSDRLLRATESLGSGSSYRSVVSAMNQGRSRSE
jgi:ABC-type phosphate/phosphonate transport system ATPase subunit